LTSQVTGQVASPPATRWERLGRQLRHPDGRAGWLLGHAMAFANRGPNRAAIAALDLRPAENVLELGFGSGTAIPVLAAQAWEGRIYGIDNSKVMLKLACRRNRALLRSGRVELKLGSFERLPLPDAAVDKILAVNVVYFWDDARSVLEELRRVLRPRGRVAIYATDAAAMRSWKCAGPETHRLFDRRSLAELLANGGFAQDGIAVREVRAAFTVPGLIATAER